MNSNKLITLQRMLRDIEEQNTETARLIDEMRLEIQNMADEVIEQSITDEFKPMFEGKSDILRQVAEKCGVPIVDISAPDVSPDDIGFVKPRTLQDWQDFIDDEYNPDASVETKQTLHKMLTDDKQFKARAEMVQMIHRFGAQDEKVKARNAAMFEDWDTVHLIYMDIEKRMNTDMENIADMCEHNWVSADNEVVTGALICTECRKIKPESDND